MTDNPPAELAAATGSEGVPTIAEIEALLEREDQMEIEIQPDGSIKAVPKGTADNQQPAVLTMKRAIRDYF